MIRILACTTLMISVSLTNIQANAAESGQAPSNAELYRMVLELKQELAAAKTENARLEDLVETFDGPADTYDESIAIAEEPIKLDTRLEESYLNINSSDDKISYRFDGRILVDGGYANNSGSNTVHEDIEIRRLRFAVKTKFYENWQGELDVGFEDIDGEVDVNDAWISYTGLPNTLIRIGNHRPHFSMDELTTSRWNNTIERSMITDAWATGRRVGISASNWNTNYLVGVSVFGDPWDVEASDEAESEEFGWTARTIYRPYVSADGSALIHLGANFQKVKPESDEDDELRYRPRPEARFIRIFSEDEEEDSTRYLDTDNIEANSAFTWGLELAAKKDNFYFQAEYQKTEVSAIDEPDPEFDGWYAKAAWIVSGGTREYSLSDGEFAGVFPNSRWGTVELVGRYSTIDLNDISADIEGGEAKNVTLGVNWYLNNNFLMRFNYVNVNNDENADGDGDFEGNDDVDLYFFRAQYVF